ncbi:uncharacterized protein LOC123539075 [Mercenaria mercenaria]|uniref:uncharacterized protein LOC123539075 n=1 Tax=Mercenaria mercenaria TaxID=6596 RepID=UPI001E1DAB5F|nr:uncharacterized protein LOC123539075 [Mercenaria mercenaria]
MDVVRPQAFQSHRRSWFDHTKGRSLPLIYNMEMSSCKKERDNNETEWVFANAWRTLYGQTPLKDSKPDCTRDATSNCNGINAILMKLDSLAYEVKLVNKSLTERIDLLETELELKLMGGKNLKKWLETDDTDNRSLNLGFRKVPETVNENIVEKIIIINDHMKVEDVKVSSAKRIPNRNEESVVPGIVIATFADKNERSKILKAKKNLKDIIYNNVFVHVESKEERITANNLRCS